MKKKFIISMLIMAVSLATVMFAYNQVAAQAPTDSVRVFVCENGEMLQANFDGGQLVTGYYCAPSDVISPGQCSNWQQMTLVLGSYICNNADKDDCRSLQNAQFFVSCTPGALGMGGGVFFSK